MVASPSTTPHRPAAAHGVWLALRLDGRGGAEEIPWRSLADTPSQLDNVWVHLDPAAAEATPLMLQMGVQREQRDALLREEGRSFLYAVRDGGFVASLHGVNPTELNATDGELSSIRLLARQHHMVSVSKHPLPSVHEIRDLLLAGRGPENIAQLILSMTTRLGDALQAAAVDHEVPLSELEYQVEARRAEPSDDLRAAAAEIARLGRHVAPFDTLLHRVLEYRDTWLVADSVGEWQRVADQTRDTDRLLQTLQDRTRTLRDQVMERLSRRTNRILYVLTLLSAVVMPIGLVTGFLGINVGIEGANLLGLGRPLHVLLVCGLLLGLAAAVYGIIRRWRLL